MNADTETISLACWDCNAIYASPKDKPQCPNCGWVPKELMLTRDDVWADPAAVIIGRPATVSDVRARPRRKPI